MCVKRECVRERDEGKGEGGRARARDWRVCFVWLVALCGGGGMADGTLLLCVLLQDGWTPLHDAAYNGHQEAIELLVSKNADIQSQDDVSPSPPCVPWCAFLSVCGVWVMY